VSVYVCVHVFLITLILVNLFVFNVMMLVNMFVFSVMMLVNMFVFYVI
jgi:hypothetical protein